LALSRRETNAFKYRLWQEYILHNKSSKFQDFTYPDCSYIEDPVICGITKIEGPLKFEKTIGKWSIAVEGAKLGTNVAQTIEANSTVGVQRERDDNMFKNMPYRI
jgi:hypothetical protein